VLGFAVLCPTYGSIFYPYFTTNYKAMLIDAGPQDVLNAVKRIGCE
jgi:hypothetical protein